MKDSETRHRQGYWMGIGISLGIAIGAGLGVVFENPGTGIGIGVALGTAIGAALERKNKDKLRPLTELELRRQWRSIWIGLGLVVFLAIILIIAYLYVGK